MITLPDLLTRTPAQQYFGNGFIAGQLPDAIVTVAGVAASRRVVILDRSSRKLVWQTWSAEDGSWRVENLNRNIRYIVMAIDHENLFNAVVQDNITPAAMV